MKLRPSYKEIENLRHYRHNVSGKVMLGFFENTEEYRAELPALLALNCRFRLPDS
jgi:hypothetical protein